ncbi:MAG: pilus assembly protein [Terricaulis sp.]|nr:pilus assembly protein [Terricaulis sp.]
MSGKGCMRKLRRFALAHGGHAAVEFAVLLPVMLLLLFGSVDLIDMMQANRRAQNTAASIADVVARDTEVTTEEVTGLWSAVNLLMFPSDGNDVKIRINSVLVVDGARAEVVWSEGHGISARASGEQVTLPDGMMQPGSSLIMAETEFSYRSPLGFLTPSARTFRHTIHRRSRLVDPIPRV